MVFKISVKKSWSIFINILFIVVFILLGFSIILLGNLDMQVQMLIIFLPVLLLLSYFTLTFTFFRSVKFQKDNLLLHFGPELIYKKYYFRDMKDIRYANKEDYITRQHPAMGITEKTVAITFKDEKMLFISVERTSEFYELLLNKIKETNCKFSGM